MRCLSRAHHGNIRCSPRTDTTSPLPPLNRISCPSFLFFTFQDAFCHRHLLEECGDEFLHIVKFHIVGSAALSKNAEKRNALQFRRRLRSDSTSSELEALVVEIKRAGRTAGRKFNIFLHQKKGARVVVNAYQRSDLDTILAERLNVIENRSDDVTVFTGEKILEGNNCVYEKDGMIYHGSTPVLAVSDIKIPGRHNVENYMAAIGALWGIASIETIQKIAREFGGVEHRIEYVREVNGAHYYNSSIDSSPTRTIAALNAFGEKKLIVLLGGYDKKIPYEPLGAPLCQHAKTVILTGSTASAIQTALVNCNLYQEGAPEIFLAKDYAESVAIAHRIAQKGDVILLSPASASFDAFRNFEERGRFFKDLVNKL